MYKSLKNTVVDANSIAMESDTIQKNGVSPKNLIRSRRNRVEDTKSGMPKPETKTKHFLLRTVGKVVVLTLLLSTVCNVSAQQRDPAKPEMVFVQGGTFTMGCISEQGADCFDNEKPAHKVTLSNFYIGKYEVTQAEWKAIMGNNPSNFSGCDNCPVEKVSWNDVQEFIRKLNAKTGKNYRLPTEAEWEYAARGGNRSKGYKYSGSNSVENVAWYGYDNSGKKTHPVGTKQANELGIYDMSGNVHEWCQDWYGAYSNGAQTNPKGASSGSYRVFRGGGWYRSAGGVCVSNRFRNTPDSRRDGSLGFRLACSSK
ncbi:MAG: formylglycine-generating enzyme family protein [Prevotellaceae bacterium]|jgi:formylglycine-generating enzyme required for sulfatase activity|nr:formylglycine-generating enzyme family protein [Prevotellaceae bacterium]